MSDPWALSIAALALLGQIPNFFDNWEKFFKKIYAHQELSENELNESEISLLEARADWLVHKIMLLDLIVAFANEHTMNPQVVEFCESQRPQVFSEFKNVNARIKSINPIK